MPARRKSICSVNEGTFSSTSSEMLTAWCASSNGAAADLSQQMASERTYKAIAQAVGTPFYCYDAAAIRARFRRLCITLPPGIRYLYSVKANPNKAIVQILHAEGVGCEVCS